MAVFRGAEADFVPCVARLAAFFTEVAARLNSCSTFLSAGHLPDSSRNSRIRPTGQTNIKARIMTIQCQPLSPFFVERGAEVFFAVCGFWGCEAEVLLPSGGT